MQQPARRPLHNFIAAACVAIGMHAGVLVHALLAPEVPTSVTIGPVYVGSPHVTATTPAQGPTAVHCRSRNRCTIDRVALLHEPMPFARGTTLAPVADGLRLQGANGLLTRLDLRDGDVLQTLDGHPLRDGADLETAIAGLGDDGFTFTLRRGHRQLRKRVDFAQPSLRVSV
ncbi:MAG: hypothetical protein IPH07_18535 [Deltaproteobacteria bacterium]|jgi:hypothetical protein|nr:hypothetical protein [Deltaproteobacteria bacterium]MBK8715698.1 hypothetical protein [Deltaproteobacteria bacterium]